MVVRKQTSKVLGLVLLELVSLPIFISQSHAAGFDLPSSTNTLGTSQVTTPNWDSWGQPYWLQGNLCREKQGAVICLTPQQAERNRWSFPKKGEYRLAR